MPTGKYSLLFTIWPKAIIEQAKPDSSIPAISFTSLIYGIQGIFCFVFTRLAISTCKYQILVVNTLYIQSKMANPFRNRTRSANNTPELVLQREVQKVLGSEMDFQNQAQLKEALELLELKVAWAKVRLQFTEMFNSPLSQGQEKDNQRLQNLRKKAKTQQTAMEQTTFRPKFYYHQAKRDLILSHVNHLVTDSWTVAWVNQQREKSERIKALSYHLKYLQGLQGKLTELEALKYDLFDD